MGIEPLHTYPCGTDILPHHIDTHREGRREGEGGERDRESRMEGRRKEGRGIWVRMRATTVTMMTKKSHTNQM